MHQTPLLLKETPASLEADLKDALHAFFANVKDSRFKDALDGAYRLQKKNYKVKFWSVRSWAASAERSDPGELFMDCPPMRTSKAEYILLKAIGETPFPPKPESSAVYKQDDLAYAIEIGKVRTKLWHALEYVRRNSK
jgi:hypothetical protein